MSNNDNMIPFHSVAEGMQMVIHFIHVATGASVSFPAFISEYTDKFAVNWGGGEQVYGRMDPIKTYQSTNRTISVGFDVLAYNRDKGVENFINYSKLIQMLYPVYSKPITSSTRGSRTLIAPPYMRIKFSNFVSNQAGSSDQTGLLGCISGLDFNPNREAGFFHTEDGKLIPKAFNISFSYDPQHESVLGWEEKKFLTRNFPYDQRQLDTSNLIRENSGTNADVLRDRENEITGN